MAKLPHAHLVSHHHGEEGGEAGWLIDEEGVGINKTLVDEGLARFDRLRGDEAAWR